MTQTNDDKVRYTNDEATLCKWTLVQKKYIEDSFVQYFVPPNLNPPRITPLINRGYFARVYTIDRLIHDFYDICSHLNQPCQIVSIGAGFDTRAWREWSAGRMIRFVEVDFAQIVRRKAEIVQHTSPLCSPLTNVSYNTTNDESDRNGVVLESDLYVLLAADLREDDSLTMLQSVVNPNMPTLFVSEMVLVYMDPFYSDRLIEATRGFVNENLMTMFVVYETINPHDAFGRMMVNNLKNRGCDLKSIEAYPTLQSMKQRMKGLFCNEGSQDAKTFSISYDYSALYNSILPRYDSNWVKERSRISRLEMVDELEEFDLLMTHYSLTIAVNNYPIATTLNEITSTWLHRIASSATSD